MTPIIAKSKAQSTHPLSSQILTHTPPNLPFQYTKPAHTVVNAGSDVVDDIPTMPKYENDYDDHDDDDYADAYAQSQYWLR